MTVADSIAALPQLTQLATDWSFVNFRRRPQLFGKMPATLISLRRLTVSDPYPPRIPSSLFDWLGALADLRDLELAWVRASDEDLHCLSSLTNLQRLSITHNEAMTTQGFHRICALPNIRSLNIRNCKSVADISPVSKCAQLKELSIASYDYLSIAEVQAIAQLHQLEKLWLDGAFQDVRSVAYFCTMRSLRTLAFFEHCLRCDETSLASLPNLCLLEDLTIPFVYNFHTLVDYLRQMPRLRRICILAYFDASTEDVMRLRDALPRLETLEFRKSCGLEPLRAPVSGVTYRRSMTIC